MSEKKKIDKPTKLEDRKDIVRKVAEYEEEIKIQLSDDQIDRLRSDVMDMLDHKEVIEDKKKEVMKNYASQLATVDLEIVSCRRVIRDGERVEKVVIEEYLTKGNEVARFRKDNGNPIDTRTATMAELQESLPLDKQPAQQPPHEDAGEEAAEPVAATNGPAEDFEGSLREAAEQFDTSEEAFAGAPE